MRRPVRCTAIMLGVGVVLAGTMTTASATRSAPAPTVREASTPILVDCTWHSNVRPTDFILACGDGNSRLTGLRWSHWGTQSATAEGVNLVNDCKPYCAAGRFHPYTVTVRLDSPQSWKKNPVREHFTRMTLTYHTGKPEGYTQVMNYPLWN
ncbi:hypothetical protein [Streptomyces sp. NPDC046805]|uniref:hypothetical protein n=1 Tax=Streptomyces sp. NPDC046805 TaxID=3155134 RepID=UPI0033F0CAF5